MHTEELPPAIFHTDDHQAPASESDDDDFIIISEDEAETADPKTISNTSLDGWVFYRVSSAPATDASAADDVSDSESDIFILAGDEEGLESVPGESAFVCVNVTVVSFHKASPVTEAERSYSERRSCKARGNSSLACARPVVVSAVVKIHIFFCKCKCFQRAQVSGFK